MIPFINIRSQHDGFLKEFQKDIQQLFSDGDFILGKAVRKFEEEFAQYIGAKHAIGVASGTDALLLPLHALGIRMGHEVIVPAFGFIATADVVVRLGARPVFVDVDPVTCNLDPAKLEAAITEKTRAIIPVHLYGRPCDMDAIMKIASERRLPVIEDVAQATGSTWGQRKLGSVGTFGAFSFYPTKNLGGAGDGGMVTTNDDNSAGAIRLLRDHGRTPGNVFEGIGYNSRLDTIQAYYLSHKLPDLDDMIYDRIENARLYSRLLEGSGVTAPVVPEDNSHSFNVYTMIVPDVEGLQFRNRDRLSAFLKEKEIGSSVYYPDPMHLMPAMQYLGHHRGDFPVSEQIARECLSLPIWPGLKKREIELVAATVCEFMEKNYSK